MSFEVVGKLYKKFETESKSEKFQSRDFVLEIGDGQYPQLIKFQIVQDRCSLLDQYSEGEQVKVSFDLRGREWNGKYLTNLNAWRLEKADGSSNNSSPAPQQQQRSNSNTSSQPASEPTFPTVKDEPFTPAAADDDLPF